MAHARGGKRWDAWIVLAVTGVLSDRFLTTFFWHYEANPLVMGLGVLGWFFLTGGLLGVMLAVCSSRRFRLWECPSGWICLKVIAGVHWGLTGIQLVVLLTVGVI